MGAVLLSKRKSLDKLPLWKLFFTVLFVNNFFKQTSDDPVHSYENFTCEFTCKKPMELERFYIWCRYLFTYEIRKSNVKWTVSKFYMCNLGVRNMCFTYEMRTFSHMKYLIHMWNELVKNFTCEILVYKTCILHMRLNIHIPKLISHIRFSFHKWSWNNGPYAWSQCITVVYSPFRNFGRWRMLPSKWSHEVFLQNCNGRFAFETEINASTCWTWLVLSLLRVLGLQL